MKHHGIGVGYRYPQEFEGADVDQQYLPDELVDRRYYLPTDQGYEATIAGRQAARAGGAGRREAKPAGRPETRTRRRRSRKGGDLMRTREANRKKLAETEKRDADAS